MRRVVSTGEITVESAARNLQDYFTELMPRTGRVRSSSRFDSWAGGGDAPEVVNRFTSDDVVAASFRSVKIPARTAVGLLETRAGDISDLLAAIPADIDLPDADAVQDLGAGSPARQLWNLLRGRHDDDGGWGVGPSTASKLLARKRPRLIPVYDSIIRRVTALPGPKDQWEYWHASFADGVLAERLAEIRAESGITEPISDLRVLDIVLSMHGKRQGFEPQEEDLEA
ncbi:DUF6308 family protein [Arthrobacter gengyunqii]|uniref:DUF6308 family protein n=1 Tax=Arthrobacter gengyunqii TaxID=2886940 RepID=A0A9X1M0J5_9MICC|nr:DUF6308 family protein [Arthrobacter gengyunqii]MCC3268635.1 DUF6308 family protein [Arthrobacter gengyunqii]UOY96022.1 DUF6308 family protein [Arthrobacter gengyunqii]